nr:pirin family protein [Oceanococcus sp. HetDA_MAG_MS8]
MLDYPRPAADRGAVDMGWLQSRHSFSFGSYYDPAHMGWSVLRVINDDEVAPGAGFGTHGHRDMEIISYVLEGALEHRDSMGHSSILRAGEVQRMTAGTGVQHSEFNASRTDPVKFLQIWVMPERSGLQPSYEQKPFARQPGLQALVTRDGREGSLKIHQDMQLLQLELEPGEQRDLAQPERWGYLHVLQGQAELHQRSLGQADAVGWRETSSATVKAGPEGLQALVFDLPAGAHG